MSLTIVTEKSQKFTVQLTINGAPFTIDPSSDVHAALVSWNSSTKFTSDIAQSPLSVGAIWATSLVMVHIPGAETENIPLRVTRAKLELQVSYSGFQETWLIPVKVVKGHIATPEPEPEPEP